MPPARPLDPAAAHPAVPDVGAAPAPGALTYKAFVHDEPPPPAAVLSAAMLAPPEPPPYHPPPPAPE